MNVGALKNYRAHVEDRLQAECIELINACEQAQTTRARLEADEERQAQAFLAQSAAGIGPEEAALALANMDALAARLAKAKAEETALQAAVERKRSEVIEASRERKKLEMLEARREREQRATQDRRAQQLMDEIAARRAANEKGVA